jgi:mannitol-specific phosphotransferase system IIBC component
MKIGVLMKFDIVYFFKKSLFVLLESKIEGTLLSVFFAFLHFGNVLDKVRSSRSTILHFYKCLININRKTIGSMNHYDYAVFYTGL